jgi:ubiquinone/menaquinone biosynthesis C-methylase UbiE
VVHRVAAKGFSEGAEAYERGRPGYPREAIDWLAERLGLASGPRVIDLAAGTGKLSRALHAAGAEVVAVEPLARMRALIERPIRAVEGTAEHIPLPDGSADAVTVAQAFHWFDGEHALAEIHRVLRPGGGLALVWNVRLMDDPGQAAVEKLIAPYTGEIPRHRSGEWRRSFEATTLFGPLEERSFPNQQRLDADGLADRVGSTSAIAALDRGERDALLERVRGLAAEAPLTLRYRCDVQVTRPEP